MSAATSEERRADPSALPDEVRAFIRANPSTTLLEVVDRFEVNPTRDQMRIAVAIDAARAETSEDRERPDDAQATKGGAGA